MIDAEVAGNIRRLIREIEGDPFGWHSLDLHKLLDLCGFERRELDPAQPGAKVFRYHPEHRGMAVLIYWCEGIHPVKAQSVAGIASDYLRQLGFGSL